MIDLAVRERQPVLTPDILMEPRVSLTPELRAAIEAAQYHAVLAVPLIVQDRVIGALGVGDVAGRSFGAEEVEIVRAFADQAAIVLENHQLYGELREALTAVRSSQQQLVATERLQAVGTLAAGVTHYVNNVLQAVLGSAQLLLRESTEPGVRKRLETLERTTMDAADIMRRVKAFTEATTLLRSKPRVRGRALRDREADQRADRDGHRDGRVRGARGRGRSSGYFTRSSLAEPRPSARTKKSTSRPPSWDSVTVPAELAD